MPPTCAACGLAIRNDQDFGVLGSYVLHRLCMEIPQKVWKAATPEKVLRALTLAKKARRDRDFIANELRAERERAVHLRRELEVARRPGPAAYVPARQPLPGVRARQQATSPGATARLAADLNRANAKIKELEAEVAAARAQIPSDGSSTVDTTDDSEARFALLELDGDVEPPG